MKKVKSLRKAARPRRRIASKTENDPLDDFIAAGAQMLTLQIDKSWMPAVRGHLQVTLAHGARVATFVLPDDAEPAPVFEV